MFNRNINAKNKRRRGNACPKFIWRCAIPNEVTYAAKLKQRKNIASDSSYKNKTGTMQSKQSKDEIRRTS